MASSTAMKFTLLLLFALLSYPQTQARDSQLFNKVPSSSGGGEATTVVPNQDPPQNNHQQEQEPSFFPQEKDNGYGLYGHESVQLPRSAAAESEDHPNRHLPRNYNPVAYLTEPEEETDENDNDDEEDSYTTTLQNYYNDIRKSKQKQQEDEETLREPEQYRSSYNSNNDKQYRYNSEAAAGNSRENNLYNGGEESGFQSQGMSDTRYLENGKYFYDIKTEKYSRNHPYAVLNRAGANNINYNDQSNYYGANSNDNSISTESYQNQYEFQNEGN